LGANLENLTLTGTAAINGTGNALDNTLTGNGVANTLMGGAGNDTLKGGLGADTMAGGVGNDSYFVDNTADVVAENFNEGIDTVSSTVTFTLGAEVENLTLTGTVLINGTGNALDNVLIGNSAVNSLTGGAGNDTLNGGVSNDVLIGGLGNDIYIVDSTADVVTENLGEGTDTVQASATFTLAANVENLILTGIASINGTGNALDNVLTGNAGINILNGGAGNDTIDGGAAADTLVGGMGADVYKFGVGYGIDTVQENDATVGIKDAVQFVGSVTQSNALFKQVGNNLEVLVNGGIDKVVVQNWYLGTQYHVEEFRFSDGAIVLDSQVQGLVSAMAAFAPADSGVASTLLSRAHNHMFTGSLVMPA
jgi:Ca2+-binding RTX toxin-like protein